MQRTRLSITLIATCATAVLATGCANTSDSAAGKPAGGSGSAGAGIQVVAQPENQGQALLDAIASAKKTIDIVVYQIGDPVLNSALATALKNGVAVRLVLDGFNTGNHTNNLAAAQAIKDAAMALGATNPNIKANFSSTNFNITHQKTAIIDGQATDGNPQLLISTGNFSQYEGKPWYHSRDFYVTTSDPTLISQVQSVFNSDFNCDGPTVTNNLVSADPLIWSNGSTGVNKGDPAGAYPQLGPTSSQPLFGYFQPWASQNPSPTVQGNSMARQLAIIKAAGKGDVLRVYNEEQKSAEIQAALLAAVGAGADVRIIETFETINSSAAKYGGDKVTNLINLAKAGATVNLMAPDSVANSVYIHAKMITLNPADGSASSAYVGSINFSDPSMNDNRELGIKLGANDSTAITSMTTTFDSDYAKAAPVAYLMNKTNQGADIPASWATASAKAGPDADAPDQPTKAQLKLKGSAPTPNVSTCGPVGLTGSKAK